MGNIFTPHGLELSVESINNTSKLPSLSIFWTEVITDASDLMVGMGSNT